MSILPISAPAPTGALRLPRLGRGGTQVGIFLLAYLVYSIARWLTVGELPTATANAQWILELEHGMALNVEQSVQDALAGSVVLWILNHLYLAAQLVVLPGALYLLYRRSRQVYARLRDTVLATWLLSIPVYALFPVAPPRLAGMGMVDTITQQTGFALDSKLTTKFFNELAAVPSLHTGFAFAVGFAIAGASSNRIVKLLGYLWGPTIALAVVATGNHFVFDIAAGIAAAAIGYGIALVVRGWRPRVRLPQPATA